MRNKTTKLVSLSSFERCFVYELLTHQTPNLPSYRSQSTALFLYDKNFGVYWVSSCYKTWEIWFSTDNDDNMSGLIFSWKTWFSDVTGYRTTSLALKWVNCECSLGIIYLLLSWRSSLSYRNQSIDFQSKSPDWFLYNRDFRLERVHMNAQFSEKCKCAYQGVRSVSFLENFGDVLNGWSFNPFASWLSWNMGGHSTVAQKIVGFLRPKNYRPRFFCVSVDKKPVGESSRLW